MNKVAASFARAAASYDAAASMQRLAAEQLLKLLPANFKPSNWLDLGCGTGYLGRKLHQQFPSSQGYALDIAPAMLKQAQQQASANFFILGNAQQLPVADQSLDLIASNLALQWCDELGQVIQQAHHALKPGGLLLFSSLACQSLYELRQCFDQLDQQQHLKPLRSWQQYQQQCQHNDLGCLALERQQLQQHYPNLKQLLLSLKHTGANHVPQRGHGLMSRRKYQQLEQAYNKLRQPEGLPLSWELIYVLLHKPSTE